MRVCNATIVIPTQNRRDDLGSPRATARRPRAAPEVLVIDDGSTDGTGEFVRRTFPRVRVDRQEKSRGLIVERNHGARIATRDVVISVDDDCTFESPRTIVQTLADFDHPRVGAVAIPYIEPKISNVELSGAPRGPEHDATVWCTWTYNGCAHAVRRDLFLRLGGYFEPLFQYKEEVDYCARLLDAGYVVRMGRADAIAHHQTPVTRPKLRHRYMHARSTQMFAWRNTPMPWLVAHLGATTLREVPMALKFGGPWHTLKGVVAGHVDGLRHLGSRGPVSTRTYNALRAMKGSGFPQRWPGLPLADVEKIIGPSPAPLPPIAPTIDAPRGDVPAATPTTSAH